jgi:outer membrane protein
MSLRSRLLGCVAGGLLGAASLGADRADATTIQEALAAAYASNPALLAERAKLRATDEDVPQALSGWRPTVTVTGTAGAAGGNLKQAGVTTKLGRDIATGQVVLTQPLFTGGRTRAKTNQAENTVRGERARLIATEQQTLVNAVNAYVGVIQDEQLLQLNINNVQVLTRQLQATNDRYRVGELTRTDVAQAEAALAGGQAQVQTAAGNLATARATYVQVIGSAPDKLVEPQPLSLPTKARQDAITLASASNPSVIAALFDNAAAKDAVNVAFSALAPTVSVQGTYGRSANAQFADTWQYSPAVVATLTVPIYQGGAEYSAVRQARQTEQQTRKTVDDARRTAAQQASQAWDTLIAARAAAESQRAAVRANEIALQGVEQEAIVGSRTTQDVLNQQQQLLGAQTTLVQDLASLVVASYSLAGTVGRLTARDLSLQVPLYDETKYYEEVRNAWFGTGDAAVNQPGR